MAIINIYNYDKYYIGVNTMATKSFLKNIVITNKSNASAFLSALENAEGKKCKEVNFDVSVKTIKDKETIKKLFKKGQPNGI